MTLTRNPALPTMTGSTARPGAAGSAMKPVRMSTARRALARISTGAVRTHAEGDGAPGISPRTLHTLDARGLVRYGDAVPGHGRPVRPTRAGVRAIVSRGPAGTAAWLWLLDQDELWVAADGSTFLIAEMPPPYCANVAAWLQRNAALIRRYAAPQRRVDPLAWIDATPLMRALVESAAD
ncbi:hypothetical protein [Yinghuangia soli]|uniref:Uncharacterized protein n=1 Tax=Yinghuangia soli TaxID=2908204 RepID=A0AA41Q2B3_9ACTN|nr:hypothetical protein [Yinghuangia soli]MCF2530238.1 hypothetical protein [Yinghuangia soli]